MPGGLASFNARAYVRTVVVNHVESYAGPGQNSTHFAHCSRSEPLLIKIHSMQVCYDIKYRHIQAIRPNFRKTLSTSREKASSSISSPSISIPHSRSPNIIAELRPILRFPVQVETDKCIWPSSLFLSLRYFPENFISIPKHRVGIHVTRYPSDSSRVRHRALYL